MEQRDLHGRISRAAGINFLLQQGWKAWAPCRYNVQQPSSTPLSAVWDKYSNYALSCSICQDQLFEIKSIVLLWKTLNAVTNWIQPTIYIFDLGLKYRRFPTRKTEPWSPLHGAAQWVGAPDCKEQQVFQQRIWNVTFISWSFCWKKVVQWYFLFLTIFTSYKMITIIIRWEVGAGQWNPSQQFGNHIAICCNDKVDIPLLYIFTK